MSERTLLIKAIFLLEDILIAMRPETDAEMTVRHDRLCRELHALDRATPARAAQEAA